MMNEVEKHLKRFILDKKILCFYLIYKVINLILLSVMAFKNHIAKVHKIFLRV